MSIEATQSQIDYMEIPFGDLGFTRLQRNAWISREVGREVPYLDELTKDEASALIGLLKALKEDRKPGVAE
jgi:hypothetical protein